MQLLTSTDLRHMLYVSFDPLLKFYSGSETGNQIFQIVTTFY